MKVAREFSRDKPDERMCIDGNLAVTDQIINSKGKGRKLLPPLGFIVHIIYPFFKYKHVLTHMRFQAIN